MCAHAHVMRRDHAQRVARLHRCVREFATLTARLLACCSATMTSARSTRTSALSVAFQHQTSSRLVVTCRSWRGSTTTDPREHESLRDTRRHRVRCSTQMRHCHQPAPPIEQVSMRTISAGTRAYARLRRAVVSRREPHLQLATRALHINPLSAVEHTRAQLRARTSKHVAVPRTVTRASEKSTLLSGVPNTDTAQATVSGETCVCVHCAHQYARLVTRHSST
jgi:hypothetical protein